MNGNKTLSKLSPKLVKISKDDHIHYCDQVREIMGATPTWTIRWGITVIAAVLLIMGIGCCFIKYPQKVSSNISLACANCPINLEAQYEGIIDMVAEDGQLVKQGDLIALLKNTADYNDVLAIKYFVDSARLRSLSDIAYNPVFDKNRDLGDIQSKWMEMLSLVREYQLFHTTCQNEKRCYLQSGQIAEVNECCIVLAGQIELADNGGNRPTRNDIRISDLEFERGTLAVDVWMRKRENEFNLKYSQAISDLIKQIAGWMESYAVIAPFDGEVSLQSICKRGRFVHAGEVLASIIPDTSEKLRGRMAVASDVIERITAGQDVNVHLSGSLDSEFCIIKGVVISKSQFPEILQDGSIAYNVEVSFPKELAGTNTSAIPYMVNMNGIAEVIIRNQSLMAYIVEPIFSLFRN